MSAAGKTRPSPNRRRDKPQLSCMFCRKRKRRCDRAKPCGTCMSSGLPPASCSYLEAAQQPGSHHHRSTKVDLVERVRQLEEELKELKGGGGGAGLDEGRPTTTTRMEPSGGGEPCGAGAAQPPVVAVEREEELMVDVPPHLPLADYPQPLPIKPPVNLFRGPWLPGLMPPETESHFQYPPALAPGSETREEMAQRMARSGVYHSVFRFPL